MGFSAVKNNFFNYLLLSLVLISAPIKCTLPEESSSSAFSSSSSSSSTQSPLVATTLGNLYRQARSEHYHAARYASDGSSVSSGAIGVRGEPEHRDAAYYEQRCITCDPNKPLPASRGWRSRTRHDYYDDDPEPRRYRDRYEEYYDRERGYEYDRPRVPAQAFDYERKGPGYEYDRARGPPYDYDRAEPYVRHEPARPIPYYDRYDMLMGRDRLHDMRYDRNYDRFFDRGNGYDNLDQRHGYRHDPYDRRPTDDPYVRYDRYNRISPNRGYENDYWDPYEKNYRRRPYEDRQDWYDKTSGRGGPDSRGYYSSSAWGPGYDRGYASAWNYMGHRDSWRYTGRDRDSGDNWKDLNRDRDSGSYRPRDYFYDSTVPPGGLRGTSYLYDRAESSTKPDSTERDKPTSSPQAQDNKVYKD
ncbi:uncharacterized protein LOC103578839 [Microplitis demolitor]|uniref:uncharacterized protein LOC103578839 n=1 Tax=Microplitis demolitor TaxID=69319 RepID=UPI0004CCF344|nr:uncharacterized protein LOC103578839 [Microplitis demolitor]